MAGMRRIGGEIRESVRTTGGEIRAGSLMVCFSNQLDRRRILSSPGRLKGGSVKIQRRISQTPKGYCSSHSALQLGHLNYANLAADA